MTPEKEKPLSPQKPPIWWHEAIRNNIEGSLITPHKFESFPTPITEGLAEGCVYTILSITKCEEEDYFPEGIYVLTNIPEEINANLGKTYASIVIPIMKLFEKEKARLYPGKQLDPKLSELGVEYSLNGSVSIRSVPTSSGIVLLLLPATEEDVKNLYIPQSDFERFKTNLVKGYFENYDDADRIALLFDENFPRALKKEILKVELRAMKLMGELLASEGAINDKTRKEIADDTPTQEFYKTLITLIGIHQTHSEGENLINVLENLEPKKFLGWLDFYKKYWEDRFGPLL